MSHRFSLRDEGEPPTPRATVDVQLTLPPNGIWKSRALIDTGSPLTLFDRAAANALGIRINSSGARSGSIALLGGRRPIQYEYVELCLLQDRADVWTADVAFVKDPGFQMPFAGILGLRGFLDRFDVHFRCYNGYFEVGRSSSS